MKVIRPIIIALGLWWAMMAIHEAGHVLSALMNGATIDAVTLWPWTISQTDRHGSTNEIMDLLAGPVFGSLIPLLLYLSLRKAEKARFYTGIWAGLCLVVNGIYLTFGWLEGSGNDSGDLVARGVHPAYLVIGFIPILVLGVFVVHWEIEQRRRSKG